MRITEPMSAGLGLAGLTLSAVVSVNLPCMLVNTQHVGHSLGFPIHTLGSQGHLRSIAGVGGGGFG